jgi:hypothetical protein
MQGLAERHAILYRRLSGPERSSTSLHALLGVSSWALLFGAEYLLRGTMQAAFSCLQAVAIVFVPLFFSGKLSATTSKLSPTEAAAVAAEAAAAAAELATAAAAAESAADAAEQEAAAMAFATKKKRKSHASYQAKFGTFGSQ